MKREKQPAATPSLSKPRKAINAIKNSQSYADIQHFYKSKLKYSQAQEKEPEQSYILGYN